MLQRLENVFGLFGNVKWKGETVDFKGNLNMTLSGTLKRSYDYTHWRCELCGKQAMHIHHKFSQTKRNVKLYPEYIHDHRNLMHLCYNCHMNKTVPKMNEREFCEVMGIQTRSKSGLL